MSDSLSAGVLMRKSPPTTTVRPGAISEPIAAPTRRNNSSETAEGNTPRRSQGFQGLAISGLIRNGTFRGPGTARLPRAARTHRWNRPAPDPGNMAGRDPANVLVRDRKFPVLEKT